MVHYRFDDHFVFKYQYRTEQIIVPFREFLECPQVGRVLVARVPGISPPQLPNAACITLIM
jgi:hypothetical protein